MKLPSEFEFEPGDILCVFKAGNAAVVHNPQYDPGYNIITGERIAMDGIGESGDIIIVDVDEVRTIEGMTPASLENMTVLTTDRVTTTRIKSGMETKQVIQQAKDCGFIRTQPIPGPTPNGKGPKISPPE